MVHGTLAAAGERRQPSAHALIRAMGTNLQGAGAHADDLGRLVHRQALDLQQKERLALVIREIDHREREKLACLRAQIRGSGRLRKDGRRGVAGLLKGADATQMPRRAPPVVEDDVARDAKKPGHHRLAGPKAFARLVELEPGILIKIVGRRSISASAVQKEPIQRRPEERDEAVERTAVSRLIARHQLGRLLVTPSAGLVATFGRGPALRVFWLHF
jgi:hypothetical protein